MEGFGSDYDDDDEDILPTTVASTDVETADARIPRPPAAFADIRGATPGARRGGGRGFQPVNHAGRWQVAGRRRDKRDDKWENILPRHVAGLYLGQKPRACRNHEHHDRRAARRLGNCHDCGQPDVQHRDNMGVCPHLTPRGRAAAIWVKKYHALCDAILAGYDLPRQFPAEYWTILPQDVLAFAGERYAMLNPRRNPQYEHERLTMPAPATHAPAAASKAPPPARPKAVPVVRPPPPAFEPVVPQPAPPPGEALGAAQNLDQWGFVPNPFAAPAAPMPPANAWTTGAAMWTAAAAHAHGVPAPAPPPVPLAVQPPEQRPEYVNECFICSRAHDQWGSRSDYCLLCNNWATCEHLTSPKHWYRLNQYARQPYIIAGLGTDFFYDHGATPMAPIEGMLSVAALRHRMTYVPRDAEPPPPPPPREPEVTPWEVPAPTTARPRAPPAQAAAPAPSPTPYPDNLAREMEPRPGACDIRGATPGVPPSLSGSTTADGTNVSVDSHSPSPSESGSDSSGDSPFVVSPAPAGPGPSALQILSAGLAAVAEEVRTPSTLDVIGRLHRFNEGRFNFPPTDPSDDLFPVWELIPEEMTMFLDKDKMKNHGPLLLSLCESTPDAREDLVRQYCELSFGPLVRVMRQATRAANAAAAAARVENVAEPPAQQVMATPAAAKAGAPTPRATRGWAPTLPASSARDPTIWPELPPAQAPRVLPASAKDKLVKALADTQEIFRPPKDPWAEDGTFAAPFDNGSAAGSQAESECMQATKSRWGADLPWAADALSRTLNHLGRHSGRAYMSLYGIVRIWDYIVYCENVRRPQRGEWYFRAYYKYPIGHEPGVYLVAMYDALKDRGTYYWVATAESQAAFDRHCSAQFGWNPTDKWTDLAKEAAARSLPPDHTQLPWHLLELDPESVPLGYRAHHGHSNDVMREPTDYFRFNSIVPFEHSAGLPPFYFHMTSRANYGRRGGIKDVGLGSGMAVQAFQQIQRRARYRRDGTPVAQQRNQRKTGRDVIHLLSGNPFSWFPGDVTLPHAARESAHELALLIPADRLTRDEYPILPSPAQSGPSIFGCLGTRRSGWIAPDFIEGVFDITANTWIWLNPRHRMFDFSFLARYEFAISANYMVCHQGLDLDENHMAQCGDMRAPLSSEYGAVNLSSWCNVKPLQESPVEPSELEPYGTILEYREGDTVGSVCARIGYVWPSLEGRCEPLNWYQDPTLKPVAPTPRSRVAPVAPIEAPSTAAPSTQPPARVPRTTTARVTKKNMVGKEEQEALAAVMRGERSAADVASAARAAPPPAAPAAGPTPQGDLGVDSNAGGSAAAPHAAALPMPTGLGIQSVVVQQPIPRAAIYPSLSEVTADQLRMDTESLREAMEAQVQHDKAKASFEADIQQFLIAVQRKTDLLAITSNRHRHSDATVKDAENELVVVTVCLGSFPDAVRDAAARPAYPLLGGRTGLGPTHCEHCRPRHDHTCSACNRPGGVEPEAGSSSIVCSHCKGGYVHICAKCRRIEDHLSALCVTYQEQQQAPPEVAEASRGDPEASPPQEDAAPALAGNTAPGTESVHSIGSMTTDESFDVVSLASERLQVFVDSVHRVDASRSGASTPRSDSRVTPTEQSLLGGGKRGLPPVPEFEDSRRGRRDLVGAGPHTVAARSAPAPTPESAPAAPTRRPPVKARPKALPKRVQTAPATPRGSPPRRVFVSDRVADSGPPTPRGRWMLDNLRLFRKARGGSARMPEPLPATLSRTVNLGNRQRTTPEGPRSDRPAEVTPRGSVTTAQASSSWGDLGEVLPGEETLPDGAKLRRHRFCRSCNVQVKLNPVNGVRLPCKKCSSTESYVNVVRIAPGSTTDHHSGRTYVQRDKTDDTKRRNVVRKVERQGIRGRPSIATHFGRFLWHEFKDRRAATRCRETEISEIPDGMRDQHMNDMFRYNEEHSLTLGKLYHIWQKAVEHCRTLPDENSRTAFTKEVAASAKAASSFDLNTYVEAAREFCPFKFLFDSTEPPIFGERALDVRDPTEGKVLGEVSEAILEEGEDALADILEAHRDEEEEEADAAAAASSASVPPVAVADVVADERPDTIVEGDEDDDGMRTADEEEAEADFGSPSPEPAGSPVGGEEAMGSNPASPADSFVRVEMPNPAVDALGAPQSMDAEGEAPPASPEVEAEDAPSEAAEPDDAAPSVAEVVPTVPAMMVIPSTLVEEPDMRKGRVGNSGGRVGQTADDAGSDKRAGRESGKVGPRVRHPPAPGPPGGSQNHPPGHPEDPKTTLRVTRGIPKPHPEDLKTTPRVTRRIPKPPSGSPGGPKNHPPGHPEDPKTTLRVTRRTPRSPPGPPGGTQNHPPGHPEDPKITPRVTRRIPKPPSGSAGGHRSRPPGHPAVTISLSLFFYFAFAHYVSSCIFRNP